ncbi:flagellar biosynthesis anti-sigma factor FlgM [Sphingomonas sp. CARO-RG-8B-R24-01]|uniref:flagellar biosynthesis anti-sigma factor FlgM n=1 Tax=unclassified Sphingomonas TaxID=196159 RepID=UPI001F598225
MDAIGPKTVSTPDRLVVSTTPVTTVASVAKQPAEVARQPLELSAIASEVGKGVPVDSQHVEDVRRAVRNGTYPITPDTIADRMLALKLNWSPKK